VRSQLCGIIIKYTYNNNHHIIVLWKCRWRSIIYCSILDFQKTKDGHAVYFFKAIVTHDDDKLTKFVFSVCWHTARRNYSSYWTSDRLIATKVPFGWYRRGYNGSSKRLWTNGKWTSASWGYSGFRSSCLTHSITITLCCCSNDRLLLYFWHCTNPMIIYC